MSLIVTTVNIARLKFYVLIFFELLWALPSFGQNVITTADGKTFYSANTLVGPGNVVSIELVSSLPSGTVTITEKNLCPATWNGGTLYMVTEFSQFLTNAMIVNGNIYAQWPPASPTGISATSSGIPINNLAPPYGPGIPTVGQTVTFNKLFAPSVYIYQMTCYYTNGCPGLGPNVGTCQWNAPSYWIGINLSSTPPPPPSNNIDLSVSSISLNQPMDVPAQIDTSDNPIIATTTPNPKKNADTAQALVAVKMTGTPSGTTATNIQLKLGNQVVADQPIDVN